MSRRIVEGTLSTGLKKRVRRCVGGPPLMTVPLAAFARMNCDELQSMMDLPCVLPVDLNLEAPLRRIRFRTTMLANHFFARTYLSS